MKEDIKNMIKRFNWQNALIVTALAIAAICYVLGLIFSLANQNAAWLLLWVPGTMAAAFIGGVCD